MKVKWAIAAVTGLGVLLVGLAFAWPAMAQQPMLTPTEALGKFIFLDENLSDPPGEACAACHAPEVGFTGPDSAINAAGAVYEGAVSGRFGNRKPPTAAYAGDSPILYYDAEAGTWVGGMFWDGRATGWMLGDPLAEQAEGPFLNPLEQNMASPLAVCEMVAASSYADLFMTVYNLETIDCVNDTTLYEKIARAVAAYERSSEVTAYTSKFDRFWGKAEVKGLDVTLIDQKNWMKYLNLGLETDELRGLAIFNTTGKCSGCHTLEAGSAGYPLFTDFTYDNLGIPRNPENPFYTELLWNPLGEEWVDLGLGAFLKSAGFDSSVYEPEVGKFKVPTLRNVDLRPYNKFVKAYGHNGYFKSLPEIVHFYNTRDVADWPEPEYALTVNTTELGNLGLTPKQEEYIVSFLKTLSDGWKH
ncbi:MAG: cytochrome C [Chloroflexi bacterium]|nr:cytochrome C [Chloroflexota bacterium]